MNREPSFDELIGAEPTGAERERLRRAHELLLQAGPPPELTPQLEAAPAPGVVRLSHKRRVKRRMTLLLAAALAAGAVFAAGYAVAGHRGGSGSQSVATIALRGTASAPGAEATLEVWHARSGNWPMTLDVSGLKALPPHSHYEVYLVRNGRPWGSCGTFRVTSSSQPVEVTLNAPYSLHKGDTWVVTRPVSGQEPGRTVLAPVPA